MREYLHRDVRSRHIATNRQVAIAVVIEGTADEMAWGAETSLLTHHDIPRAYFAVLHNTGARYARV
jgi:hypothetical protein